MKTLGSLLMIVIVLIGMASSAGAMDDAQQEQFDRVYRMGMGDLTLAAAERLEKDYPDEDWEAYGFPNYVFTNDSVEIGYMIAVKRPDLLKQVQCYCFCGAMGHKHLLHCFRSHKDMSQFDSHASECNICYGQAMMVYLWDAAGATSAEMTAAFEKRFAKLIEKYGEK